MTQSFLETKNIISGEVGALLDNDERFVERAEIIREKGTNDSTIIFCSKQLENMVSFLIREDIETKTCEEKKTQIWKSKLVL